MLLFGETKQNSLTVDFETEVISQHFLLVSTPPRAAEPFPEACKVCDLPLPVACVCTYTSVHLANGFTALAAPAHVLYKVFRQRHNLFELVGSQHESESLLLGTPAPVYVQSSALLRCVLHSQVQKDTRRLTCLR